MSALSGMSGMDGLSALTTPVLPIDPSLLPSLRLWTPSTGATGGGATAYASASSQYHFITDKPALRAASTGIGIVGQFYLATTGADQGLAGKCGNTANAAGIEYCLQYIASANRFRFSVSNGTTMVSVDAETFGAPVAGTWYSIAAWFDPVGFARTGGAVSGPAVNITVNDGGIDGATCSITPQGTTGEFRVGRVGVAYLNGRARNVAVLRRPPTASERTALHNGGTGVIYADAPASLKTTWALGGWWDLALLKPGQVAFDQVKYLNLAARSPNNFVRGTTSPPAGFSAYQTLVQASTPYLSTPIASLPSSCPGFPNTINRAGPSLSLRFRIRRSEFTTRYHGLWLATGTAVGFNVHNNMLAWFQGGSTYWEGGPTLSAGVWYDVGMTCDHHARWIFVIDGVVVHNFYFGSSAVSLDTIGGRTSTNANAFAGDMCGVEYYNDPLSPQDWADLHAGNPIPYSPVTAYRMDETGSVFEDYGRTAGDLTASGSPTPADPPVLTAAVNSLPVRRLADASGGNRHLTAPSAEPADYATDSKRLPLLGMARGIRTDQQSAKRLQAAAGAVGTVTEFTWAVAGLLSHPIDAGSLTTGGQARVCPIVGCSNNGAFGTAAGDAWAVLGYQEGRAATVGAETFWTFYAAIRPAGGPTVEAKAVQPHPFGHTLVSRFKGGQYLSLSLNGVEIARATTSIPASLPLTDVVTWGKVAGYFSSGHQLHDMVLCNQAISDTEVSRLHAYWAQQMQIVPVKSGIAYDGGPWDMSNPNGFSQMAGFVRCNNGDYLNAFCNGVTDPQQQTGKIILQRSKDCMFWDAGTIVVDGRPTYDGASGESLFKLHTAVGPRQAGDIGLTYMLEQWNSGSSSYPPGSITAWIKWSSDHGVTWSAPISIPTPSGFSDLAMFGRGLQRANGDIWKTGYAQVTATPGTWHSVIMKSTDGGVTWSLMMDMLAETGAMSTEMEVFMFDALGRPNEGIALARGGLSVRQSYTFDGGANWDRGSQLDGSGVNSLYEATTPSILLDEQQRLISVVGQRNVFYAADGKVIRLGLRMQVSLDRGQTWGPIVTLFDNRGRTNSGAVMDGNEIATSSVDETGKLRWYKFPAAALPDATTP